MLPLFRLRQSKISLDSGFWPDFDSSLHTFQTLPLKPCLNASPPHPTSSWGAGPGSSPLKKASSSDHKRCLTTFTHTRRRHKHTCSGHPPFLLTTGHLKTQSGGGPVWVGGVGGGLHICYQSHSLSEGAR